MSDDNDWRDKRAVVCLSLCLQVSWEYQSSGGRARLQRPTVASPFLAHAARDKSRDSKT